MQLGPRGWSEKNARFRVAFSIIQAWGEENMFWTKSVPVGRQRKTQQMKEQGKNPPDQTNEEEIAYLKKNSE